MLDLAEPQGPGRMGTSAPAASHILPQPGAWECSCLSGPDRRARALPLPFFISQDSFCTCSRVLRRLALSRLAPSATVHCSQRRHMLRIPHFRLTAKAHSLRCSAFPGQTRFAGLCPGSLRTGPTVVLCPLTQCNSRSFCFSSPSMRPVGVACFASLASA